MGAFWTFKHHSPIFGEFSFLSCFQLYSLRYLDAGKKTAVPSEAADLDAEDNDEADGMESDADLQISERTEDIPDIEWWDQILLVNGSYEEDVTDDAINIRPNKITIYVQHPVPIEPPAEALPPPPQPLKLTKKVVSASKQQIVCTKNLAANLSRKWIGCL